MLEVFRRRRGLEVFDKYYTVLDRHVYIACSPEQEWAWEQATRVVRQLFRMHTST